MELSCGMDLESEPFRIFDALLHLIGVLRGSRGPLWRLFSLSLFHLC